MLLSNIQAPNNPLLPSKDLRFFSIAGSMIILSLSQFDAVGLYHCWKPHKDIYETMFTLQTTRFFDSTFPNCLQVLVPVLPFFLALETLWLDATSLVNRSAQPESALSFLFSVCILFVPETKMLAFCISLLVGQLLVWETCWRAGSVQG